MKLHKLFPLLQQYLELLRTDAAAAEAMLAALHPVTQSQIRYEAWRLGSQMPSASRPKSVLH
jgi:hypothetical protein